MDNVSTIKNCYGCGVCSIACGHELITIEQDKDGFYAPRITDMDRCTRCGLCTKVCAYLHEEVPAADSEPQGYAAWSRDENVRSRCSSGGVGFEIGLALMEQGYKLCGVRYNADKHRAEHYIATTPEEWNASTGSKYIQSYTAEAFGKINRKENYLVTGTPCQIDSFRRYLRTFRSEDNFVLMDFFCHGVPSKLVWDKYLKSVERSVGKVTSVSWRDKTNGWHDSWAMAIRGDMAGEETVYTSRLSRGDAFYRMFLGNQCLGKACYHHCKYKHLASAADIRIGDLWGTAFKDEERGVSALIGLTERGNQVIAATQTVECIPHAMDDVTEGQMRTKLDYPSVMRPIQIFLAKTKVSIGFQALISRYTNKLKSRLHLS